MKPSPLLLLPRRFDSGGAEFVTRAEFEELKVIVMQLQQQAAADRDEIERLKHALQIKQSD